MCASREVITGLEAGSRHHRRDVIACEMCESAITKPINAGRLLNSMTTPGVGIMLMDSA